MDEAVLTCIAWACTAARRVRRRPIGTVCRVRLNRLLYRVGMCPVVVGPYRSILYR